MGIRNLAARPLIRYRTIRMTRLPEPPTSAQDWADHLGIDPESVALYLDSEVIDLHNDLYVPARLYGYNPHKEHRVGWNGAFYFGQTDLPRIRKSGITALTFDIATNPARTGKQRGPLTLENIGRIQSDIGQYPDQLALVTNAREYREARAANKTACFIGIQGGQAFQYDDDTMDQIPDAVHRITLVHLTNSQIGCTSSPLGPDRGGLTEKGKRLVNIMNEKRCLVDLAHINPAGFWDAVDAHQRDIPFACTHTGVDGAHTHWRNIDDDQIRAVADSGGVVGVIFHGGFLDGSAFRSTPDVVLDHAEHIIQVAGEHAPAIGTDYDGMIVPPKGLEDVMKMPVLVEHMRQRGWNETRIRNVLGLNAQRLLEAIRP